MANPPVVRQTGATQSSPTFGLGFVAPTTGIGFVFVQRTNANPNVRTRPQTIGSVTRTAFGGGPGKLPPVVRQTTGNADRKGIGITWWDRVHILPREPIDFGPIITQQEREYEIYNACRSDTVTLTSVVNNATPGVDLPDTPAGIQLPPQTSFLRAGATTPTPPTFPQPGIYSSPPPVENQDVLARVVAEQEGLPIFSASIVFTFGPNAVTLQVAGQRIFLIPFRYDRRPAVVDAMAFKTHVQKAEEGQEQRIALRGRFPRQQLTVRYALTAEQRQRFRTQMFDVQDKVVAVPIWEEEVALTADVTAGATLWPVAGADEVDFREGGLAVALLDDNTFDILNLQAVAAAQLTASDPSVNSYPQGTKIAPVRLAVILQAIDTGKRYVELEDFTVRYAVVDNETGALTPDTTPLAGVWSTYKSKVLFDGCNVGGPTFQHRLDREVVVLTAAAGALDVRSSLATNKELRPRVFSLKSRAQILAFKRLLIALRGPQVSFYVGTDSEDLTAAAALVLGSDELDIVNIGYTRFAQSREGMDEFRVTFTDGTTLERGVLSSAVVSPTVETLTLDDTWPAARTVDEIARIEFLVESRFAQDSFPFRYTQAQRASVATQIIRDIR